MTIVTIETYAIYFYLFIVKLVYTVYNNNEDDDKGLIIKVKSNNEIND